MKKRHLKEAVLALGLFGPAVEPVTAQETQATRPRTVNKELVRRPAHESTLTMEKPGSVKIDEANPVSDLFVNEQAIAKRNLPDDPELTKRFTNPDAAFTLSIPNPVREKPGDNKSVRDAGLLRFISKGGQYLIIGAGIKVTLTPEDAKIGFVYRIKEEKDKNGKVKRKETTGNFWSGNKPPTEQEKKTGIIIQGGNLDTETVKRLVSASLTELINKLSQEIRELAGKQQHIPVSLTEALRVAIDLKVEVPGMKYE